MIARGRVAGRGQEGGRRAQRRERAAKRRSFIILVKVPIELKDKWIELGLGAATAPTLQDERQQLNGGSNQRGDRAGRGGCGLGGSLASIWPGCASAQSPPPPRDRFLKFTKTEELFYF